MLVQGGQLRALSALFGDVAHGPRIAGRMTFRIVLEVRAPRNPSYGTGVGTPDTVLRMLSHAARPTLLTVGGQRGIFGQHQSFDLGEGHDVARGNAVDPAELWGGEDGVVGDVDRE